MIELFALAFLLALVIYLIRPASVLPLVIRREGRFHATLAPQLARAQRLIEALDAQSSEWPAGDSPTLCFQVDAHEGNYLLGLTRRGGVSYVQAIAPVAPTRDADPASDFVAIRDFAARVLVNISGTTINPALEAALATAVEVAARQCGVTIRPLSADARPD
jgi:hypothetical protein